LPETEVVSIVNSPQAELLPGTTLEYFAHFEVMLLYGIIPILLISTLNLVISASLSSFSSINTRESIMIGISFGAIGAAVGLLLGGSQDGVVGTVIPALLTFISSFAVYQFGQEAYSQWRPILPIALLTLVFSTVCGATFGASLRNSFLENGRKYDQWKTEYERVKLPIEKKKLEKQLGFTPEPPTSSEGVITGPENIKTVAPK
jgi:hypothetical protein